MLYRLLIEHHQVHCMSRSQYLLSCLGHPASYRVSVDEWPFNMQEEKCRGLIIFTMDPGKTQNLPEAALSISIVCSFGLKRLHNLETNFQSSSPRDSGIIFKLAMFFFLFLVIGSQVVKASLQPAL